MEVQQGIKNVLEIQTSTFESKYLGLPTPEGRIKEGKFQPNMERFTKRCSDWSDKFMSFAAKEVHVKAVIQALLVYQMGGFQDDPKFLCEI